MLLKGGWRNFSQADHCHPIHHQQTQRRQSATQAQHQEHGQYQLPRCAHGCCHRRRQQWHMVFIGKQGQRGIPVAQLGQTRQKKHLGHIQTGQALGERPQPVQPSGQGAPGSARHRPQRRRNSKNSGFHDKALTGLK
jgi:hypothetical protein